jgi:hypothetical protein
MQPCRNSEWVRVLLVLDLSSRVHAEAFADCAEQRQQRDREGADQQQTVAPHRLADASGRQPHAEAQILGVAELRLDGPAAGVVID